MPRIHETISGHRIEYADPPSKLAKLLERLVAMLDDDKVSEDEMIALTYGRDNPLLDQTVFPERGAVTKEVLEDPTYQVLTDLLTRKSFKVRGVDPAKVAERYTLTVADAATRLGVHETAIRQAIKARRVPSWVKDGRYFLEAKSLDKIRVGSRGPVPASIEPLSYEIGNDAKKHAQLRIRFDDREELAELKNRVAGERKRGEQSRWRRCSVLSGAPDGKLRYFVLEPGTKENEIKNADFFVRGKFKIVEKVNNPKRARERWGS